MKSMRKLTILALLILGSAWSVAYAEIPPQCKANHEACQEVGQSGCCGEECTCTYSGNTVVCTCDCCPIIT